MEETDFLFRAISQGFKVGMTGSVTAFHFGSYTRKKISFSEQENNNHFIDKWGWSFQEVQNQKWNKLIRSIQKRLIRFGFMSTLSENFPINYSN